MFTAFTTALLALILFACLIRFTYYREHLRNKRGRQRSLRMLMVGLLCVGMLVGCLQGCVTSKDPLTGVETTTVDVNTLAIVVQLAETSYERWQALERTQNMLSEEQEAREAERRLDRIRELRGLLDAARQKRVQTVTVPESLLNVTNQGTPTPEVVEPSGGDGSSE